VPLVLRGHLRQTGRGARDQVVGEMHEERLIAYSRPRTQHRVPETERLSLPNVDARNPGRDDVLYGFQQVVLA